jgi:hypothetical protein
MSAATSGGGRDAMMPLRANDLATNEAQEMTAAGRVLDCLRGLSGRATVKCSIVTRC